MYKQSDAEKQSDFLIKSIFEAKRSGIRLNAKLLRDMLDVIEGTRRGHLTRTNYYSHRTFKLKCRWRSRAALTQFASAEDVLKNTVRDHSLPMIIFIDQLYKLEANDLNSVIRFIDNELISVVITKEEDAHLSRMKLASTLPNDFIGQRFARYEAAGIEIIDSLESIKPRA